MWIDKEDFKFLRKRRKKREEMWRVTTKVERTNIPITRSILYERDLLLYQTKKTEKGRRRAFTEVSHIKKNSPYSPYKQFPISNKLFSVFLRL